MDAPLGIGGKYLLEFQYTGTTEHVIGLMTEPRLQPLPTGLISLGSKLQNSNLIGWVFLVTKPLINYEDHHELETLLSLKKFHRWKELGQRPDLFDSSSDTGTWRDLEAICGPVMYNRGQKTGQIGCCPSWK